MRKGLSDIFYLIIAASVLMMVALDVMFTATDTVPEEDDEKEISKSVAVEVAEDYTWMQCSVDWISEYDGDIHLNCCDQRVSQNGTTYRACEDVTVFRNESTGGIEVRQ